MEDLPLSPAYLELPKLQHMNAKKPQSIRAPLFVIALRHVHLTELVVLPARFIHLSARSSDD